MAKTTKTQKPSIKNASVPAPAIEPAKQAKPAPKQDPKAGAKAQVAEVRAELLKLAKDSGLTLEQTGGVHKVLGKGKLWLSIAKSGATVNLLGFCVDGAAPVSEAEAKARHIGRTRGQLDMTGKPEQVLAAFAKALAALQVASVLAIFVR